MLLRSALRAQTRDCHADVDEIFGRFDLSSLVEYQHFLSAHARAVPAVETAIEQAGIGKLVPDWPERRRREHLLADLAALGVEAPPLLPQPIFSTDASLWGAAYVLEGSKLGGAMLARSVPVDLPLRYLSPHGPKTGMKAFMDALDNAPVTDPSKAVAAARSVFALFHKAAEMELELPVS
jgi:heme oxygenase